MMNARSVARVLGGQCVNTRTVLCPGPGHSPQDRSLAVRLDPSAPDGFVVHSHAGDDWLACRDHVRSRLGLPAWQPGDGQRRTIPPEYVPKWDLAAVDRETEMRERTEDDLGRIKRAQQIWNEAKPAHGTLVEEYLRIRSLGLQDGDPLRFHPRCPWRNENTGKTEYIPALIAAFRSIDDDAITAVHRIRLDQPDRWPRVERKMLGIVQRAAVKFGAIGNRLAVGEGVETCMAARQLGYSPAWALGSVGAISFFPVLDSVRRLIICGEAGTESANAVCARRWNAAGRMVLIAHPEVGSDLNDELMMKGKLSHGDVANRAAR
jgi:putative DNA primase/helicase